MLCCAKVPYRVKCVGVGSLRPIETIAGKGGAMASQTHYHPMELKDGDLNVTTAGALLQEMASGFRPEFSVTTVGRQSTMNYQLLRLEGNVVNTDVQESW